MYAESNSLPSENGKYLQPNAPHNDGRDEAVSNPRVRQAVRCANCDIEILWTPTVFQGKFFCCTGCAAGGPCNCDYSQYRSVNISGVIHYEPDTD
jgi:hypothetical protein